MLGKLPVLILIMVGQGPTVLAAGAGGLDIPPICHFSLRSPSLWETARYRLQFFVVSKGR